MVVPVHWACVALLVNRPNGYDEMGIFSAANQWYAMLLFLPSSLGRVVLPVLSEQLGQNEAQQSAKTMILAMKVNALLVLPIVLLASIGSPYIMNSYGDTFKDGWPTLIVVLFTAALLSVQTPVGQVLAASGRVWVRFTMNMGWAVVFLAGTLLLVHIGSLGLASARAVAYVFHALWIFGFAFRQIQKGQKVERLPDGECF